MKNTILTLGCIVLMFVYNSTSAQTFYKSYLNSSTLGGSVGIMYPALDSGVIFCTDTGLQKVDKYGNTQWARSIHSSSRYNPSPEFVIASSTGSYFANGYYNKSTTLVDLDSNWVTKIDHSGNSVFSKVYNLYIWNMCPTDDGGFMLTGMCREQVHFTELNYIIRCDSNGNIVWKKQFADTAIGYTNCIMPSHTSGNFIIMAGYSGLAAPNNFVHCFEITGAGAVVWEKKYRTTDANLYNPYYLVNMPSGYLLSTVYANSAITDSSWKIGIIKIDNSGNVAWTGQYNDPTKLIIQNNGIAANSNGNIMVTAQYGPTNDYLYYMLDSNGNVVWGKISPGITGATNYGSAGITGIYNNRFFMGGSGSPTGTAAMIDNMGNGPCVTTPFTMTRSTLPITTLPLGITAVDSPFVPIPITTFPTYPITFHDTTYCSTLPTGEEPAPVAQPVSIVYPNPVINELNVSPRNIDWHDIKMMGIDGRTVYTTSNNSSAGKTVQINTNNLSAGLYCVQIIYTNGESETFKVVVSK